MRPIIIGVALWAVSLAPAQDQPGQSLPAQRQPARSQPAQNQQDQNQPDQTQPDQTQPDQEQTYTGPSILSRDKGLIGERGGQLIDFRFYVELMGVYDSGLTPLQVSPEGGVPNIGAYGGEVAFGVIGSHRWAHDALSIEYRGVYRDYSNHAYFNGTDQFLNLAYSHQLQRHVMLDVKETAGRVSLANGEFSFLPLTNTDLFAVPANELFDTPTNFLQSRVDLVWQKTARLSFGVGGEGFLVRRSSVALAGLNGYSGRGNVAYRLTRRQTVSANYDYTYFDFQRQFGNTRMQTVGLGYSIGLSRKWDFSTQAGGIRLGFSGLQLVPLDPAIAIIVGQPAVLVTFAHVNYVPMVEARLIRRYNRSALTVGYVLGVTPGNGVYLTSRQNLGTVSYSYAGYRRLTFAMDASYGTMTALGQTLGQLANFQAGTGGTYRLGRAMHLTLRYDYRHYTTQNSFYLKDSNRVMLGFAFSPGETPIAIF